MFSLNHHNNESEWPEVEPQECNSCGAMLNAQEQQESISCKNEHFVCVNCIPNYFRHILSEPETQIPPKCSFCQVLINPVKFESCLTTQKERDLFQAYLLEKELAQYGAEIM